MQTKVNHMQRAVLSTLGLLALATPALAQQATPAGQEEARYYGGVQFGRNNLDEWSNQVKLGAGVKVDGRTVTDAGSVAGLVLGRQVVKTEDGEQKITRYEVEYQRGKFDVQGVEIGAFSEAATGKGKYQALTLNAYRQKPWNENWSGYAGLGIGWGKAELPRVALSNGCDCVGEASKSGLVLLARAGVEYRFNQHHNAFVQYTFLNMQGPSSGSTPGVDYSRKWIGAAAIGYRYLF